MVAENFEQQRDKCDNQPERNAYSKKLAQDKA
jgi:hypothetical protein